MHFPFILARADALHSQAGKQIAKLLRERIHELVQSIRPDFHIDKIITGMGAYSLKGEPYLVSDGEVGHYHHPMNNDLIEYLAKDSRYFIKPIDGDKHRDAIQELGECLEMITNDPWIAYEDFIFE